MSIFDKLKEIIRKKKEQESTLDDSKLVSDIYGNSQHYKYIPKNVKVLEISHDKKAERIASLSERERETFELLLEGFTLKECAKQMGIKYPTVNTYTTAVYKKLGVKTRAELIINYREERQKSAEN